MKGEGPSPRTAVVNLSSLNLSHKSDMHGDFDKELTSVGSRSVWLVIVLTFMIIPGMCYTLLQTIFTKINYTDFKTRCRIPQLENRNWSFEQIQYLSSSVASKKENCYFHPYDYAKIAEMEYEEARSYVKTLNNKMSDKCSDYVHLSDNKSYTPYEEFSLVCDNKNKERVLSISTVYGQLFGFLFIAPFGDFLGRKRILNWGANIFITGAIVMGLALSVKVLIIGRIFVGMGYSAMLISIMCIVVEISTISIRPLRFAYTFMGSPTSYMAIPFLATLLYHWRLLFWTLCSFTFLIPLITWYIPESPRWFMSRAKKAKAWAILYSIKDPVAQNDLLFLYKNENIVPDDVIQHWTEFKPFAKSKLPFLIAIMFLSGSAYLRNISGNIALDTYADRSTYLFLCGIMELMGYSICLPMVCALGRKITIAVLFSSTSILYIITSQLQTGSMEGLFCLMMLEAMTSTNLIIIYLYVSENTPTSHRCTAVGLCAGLGSTLSMIITYHLYFFVTNATLFIILGCTSIFGFILVLFMQEPMQEIVCDTVEESTRPHTN